MKYERVSCKLQEHHLGTAELVVEVLSSADSGNGKRDSGGKAARART